MQNIEYNLFLLLFIVYLYNMYSVYNNQVTRAHITPLINANNIHKQTVKHTISGLEESIRSLNVVYNVDNIYSWVYQYCLVLINNRAAKLYWQLPDNIYYNLLDTGRIILNYGSKSNHYANCNGMDSVCIYFLNYILNILVSVHNFEPELVNGLQQYIQDLLDIAGSIKGLIVIYTNIKKLEQITETQYKDTPGSFKWCLIKMLESGSLMLDVLPGSVLSAGLSGYKELLTEPGLDMLEFNQLFQHVKLWPNNNSTDLPNNIQPSQDDSNDLQQVDNESLYMLEDVEPDENELLDDDWS